MPMTDEAAPPSHPFVMTKEYRRFVEFCEACRRDRYIGLCYGSPGVGKTLSARHYAQWDAVEHYGALYRETGPVPPELGDCRVTFFTAPVVGSPGRLGEAISSARLTLEQVIEEVRAPTPAEGERWRRGWSSQWHTELLIVDEADRLKLIGLEVVRDLYDQHQIGLVLIGMPGLEKRLARYPQLYSRVGFVHHFRALSEAEVRFLLAQHWTQLGLKLEQADFTDAEAMAAIIRMTSGNFRLLQRLFAQIARVLQINQLQTVTKEVVEAARESLVIGAL
jgi:DNA transposition AAA+ family ATPase